MKKPMMSNDLFDVICRKLQEKGQLPEILEYQRADDLRPFPVDTYEVDIRNNLDFGGNEGIYLDLRLYLRGEERHFGTIKTLAEDRDGIVEMGKLLGNFIAEFRDYLNDNIDDFTWDGYDVHAVRADGSGRYYAVECRTLEKALMHKDELLQDPECRYEEVKVRDNRTREEKIYRKEEIA